MNPEIIKAIEAILKRGTDVEIRRKGGGYIVLEVKKTIKYCHNRHRACIWWS